MPPSELIVVDRSPDAQNFTKIRVMDYPPLTLKFQGNLRDFDGKGYGKRNRRGWRRPQRKCDVQPVAANGTRFALHPPVTFGTSPADIHWKLDRDARPRSNAVRDFSSFSHPNSSSASLA